MAQRDLNVSIKANIKGLQAGLRSAQSELQGFARKANSLGNDLTLSVSAPLAAIGGAALSAAGDLEALQLALQSTFKDQGRTIEEANNELEKLRDTAKAPGLDFEQAVRASIRLQSVGFAAEDARKTIAELANAIAASGGTADNLSSVVNQLVQISAKGKILNEDLLIILENAPKLAGVFQDSFGGATAEAIRASGVSAKDFVAITTKGLSELDRVQGGLANSFVNFKSEVKNALGTVGLELNKTFNIQGIVEGLANKIAALAEKFRALSPEMKRTIGIITLIVASISPAIKAIGLAGSALTVLTGPVGLTVAALAALAAAFVYAYENSEQFRAGISGAISAVEKFWNILFTNVKTFVDAVRQTFVEFSPGNLVKKLLTSLNPVGQALAAGRDIGQAFSDGFAERVEKEFKANLPKVKENLQKAFPTVDFFPGTKLPGGVKAPQAASAIGTPKTLGKSPISTTALEISKVFTELEKQLKTIDVTTAVLGSSAEEALSQKADAITSAIENLIEKGINPANSRLLGLIDTLRQLRGEVPATFDLLPSLQVPESVQSTSPFAGIFGGDPNEIRSQVDGLNEAMARTGDIMTANQEKAAGLRVIMADLSSSISGALQGAIEDLAVGLGETLGDIFSGVASSGEILGNVFGALAGLLKQLGQIAIKAGAAFLALQVVFKNPLSPAGAAALIAAGAGLIALSSIIKNGIPALADGGIVNRPTLALIGEAGPEAVVPLSRHNDFNTPPEFTARISGDDLYLIMQRATRRKGRIG